MGKGEQVENLMENLQAIACIAPLEEAPLTHYGNCKSLSEVTAD